MAAACEDYTGADVQQGPEFTVVGGEQPGPVAGSTTARVQYVENESWTEVTTFIDGESVHVARLHCEPNDKGGKRCTSQVPVWAQLDDSTYAYSLPDSRGLRSNEVIIMRRGEVIARTVVPSAVDALLADGKRVWARVKTPAGAYLIDTDGRIVGQQRR